jgi:endonuclease-8
MPEGDTVWNTASTLHRALAGVRIRRSDFRVPALAAVDLAGVAVIESVSRGKHLLLRLRPDRGGTVAGACADSTVPHHGLTLHSHLRMDGSWRIFRPDQRWTGGPLHTVRAVLHTDNVVAVGYHLHELALVPTADEPRLLGHLGPDLLGEDWNPDEAVRRLRARPERPIAEALLDQRNLAGIGNLYKSEILFLRGIAPARPVSEVDDLEGLVRLAHRLLTANRGRWTQSTTGSLRRGETTYVYGRRAAPCRRCGTPIRKAGPNPAGPNRAERAEPNRAEPDEIQPTKAGLDERVTYWCPTCQPGDEARARPPRSW